MAIDTSCTWSWQLSSEGPERAACHCSLSPFVKPLEEQLVQGCGLAQTTLTNRLLFLVVVFKNCHPCCILGHRETLVCHQPWWDPPASKGSFPLGDSGLVFLFPAQCPSPRESCGKVVPTVSLSSLSLHLLISTFCFPAAPVNPLLLLPLMPPLPASSMQCSQAQGVFLLQPAHPTGKI